MSCVAAKMTESPTMESKIPMVPVVTVREWTSTTKHSDLDPIYQDRVSFKTGTPIFPKQADFEVSSL